MKRLLTISFVALLLSASTAFAVPSLIPDPPAVDVHGYYLLDYNSGNVLAEKNGDEHMEPASLTKLMTAYVVFSELRAGQIHLNDLVRISKKAWRTGGSRMFIEVGKQVSVEQLLQGMLIDSGNDAAVALSEYVAGSEDTFVALMNEHARALGMNNTHYSDATGLPIADHYTTPHDLAILARALIRDFPEYYHWDAVKEYTYDGISQHNRNLLLWRDSSVDGLKTGHTESAGYCLVASAKRDGMRLISVVMGAKTDNGRASESEKLLNYGFRFYETHKLYDAAQSLKAMRIWKGADDTVDLGIAKPLYITVPRGQYNKLSASMTIDGTIVAPTQKGQRLGTVNVKLGDQTVAQRPLIALETVPQGSLWQRMLDDVRLWFQ